MPLNVQHDIMSRNQALKVLLKKSKEVYKTVRLDLDHQDFLMDFHKYKSKLMKFQECREAYFSLVCLEIFDNLDKAESHHEIEMGDIFYGADVETVDNTIAEQLINKSL